MKNIRYSLGAVLLIMIGLLGCEKEYIAPANDNFSDAVAGASGRNKIERGTSTTFADLSQGVKTRNWEIPASAEIINLDGKEAAELDIVEVQFNEPGMHGVRLTAEFNDGTTALDTTFEVTVLDFVKTEIDIVAIDAGFFEETPTQINMYEGGQITFADSSQGQPNRRIWLFEGGDPEKAGGIGIDEDGMVQSIDVQYPNIGVYDVTLISWRQFPDGEPDTTILEEYINVVPNIDPPRLVGITDNEEGIIQVAFDLSMKFTGDLIPNFSLTVDDTSMNITNIAINPADNRILDLTPEADIEHWSNAKLSYDGLGDLSKLNGVVTAAFSEVGIDLYQPPNLLAMAGIDPTFENGTLAGWGPISDANQNPVTNNAGVFYEITNDSYDGNGALVIHLNPDENLGADQKNNFFIYTDNTTNPLNFEAGKSYRIEFWYKLVGTGTQEFTCRFHGAGWAPAPGGGWSPGRETGWNFRQITWNAPNPEALSDGRISLQFISKTNNTMADVFIDNITVYAIE